jgi:3-hydroxyisobutyrate dehydrogenase-like beta-hydroxyacid dehydrogenase
MTYTVGFIGVGNMGGPIAERFLSANIPLFVRDRNEANAQALGAKGAVVLATPRDVADNVDIVFSCLNSVESCLEVALGEDGIAQGKAAKVYVELATVGAKTVQKIASEFPSSISLVDSPVSGGPPAARAGQLSTMSSGKREHFDYVSDAISNFSNKNFFLGEEPGLAQTAKLINNHLSMAGRLATFESLVMALKAGLDLDILTELLNVSSGQNGTTMTKLKPAILSGTFSFGGNLSIALKDEKLFLDEAKALDVPLWVGPWLQVANEEAAKGGYLDKDCMWQIQFMGERAGIDVKAMIDARNEAKQKGEGRPKAT